MNLHEGTFVPVYRFPVRLLLWLCLCLLPSARVRAQLLEDKDTQEKLREAINLIYNFQFPQAEPLITTIRERYPQHPVYPMLMSLKLFWQGMPLRKENPLYPEYLDHLRKTLKQTSLLIEKSPHDPEATFFALGAHSYLALQASEEGQSMEALAEAKKAYGYLRAGSKLTETYSDFLFSTGLYNYYVVQYPATHPAVKPLLMFFADGDKAKGLQQLEKAAREGVFTRTEALFYLMHITVKHESQFSRALGYSSRLVTRFPGNLLYKMRHAELLVLNSRYRETVPFIREIQAHPDKVYQATAEILLGLIAEKSEKNLEKARGHYIRALRLKAYERRYTQDLYAMAYAGLARMAAGDGNREGARSYYKKALELAEYESTIREARNYLKNG